MNARAHLPPVPEPPHDPRSWLLAGWVGRDPEKGFRLRRALSERVAVDAASRSLALEPSPDAERRMTEASGSFGARRPPLNVALGADGAVYLLDTESGELKRFDPCGCRFVRVGCFARIADGLPLQSTHLREPHGIAICRGDLFIADSGNARIVRFALNGLVARSPLALPRAVRLKPGAAPLRWYPFALAFDGAGCLHVADSRNRRVDRFDFGGRWLGAGETPGQPWSVALDCDDRVHASLAPDDALELTQPADGAWRWQWRAGLAEAPRAVPLDDGEIGDFPAAPIAIDARGFLHLQCVEGERIFDARGAELRPEAHARHDLYRRGGTYCSEALDSGIPGCQWHRVELRGAIPAGCSVAVSTLAAEVELDAAELADPSARWQPGASASAVHGGRWDCLVPSPPGRYLWLRLELRGNGTQTPALAAIVVEFPRISLRRYLPAVYGADPAGAEFTDRFTAIFDRGLRSIEEQLDRLPALFDPLSAPADSASGARDILGWIAGWIGVALSRDWPEARRRRFLKQVGALRDVRGTARGLHRQLLLFLGFDRALEGCLDERGRRRCLPLPRNCGPAPRLAPPEAPPLVLEHFRLRRWLFAGRGRLGEDSVLWGERIVNRSQLSGNAQAGVSQLKSTPDPLRDPFHVFAHKFSVFVPARVGASPAERRSLERLLAAEAPAHAQYELRYVEPRFRVGVQAMLGLDSVVARTPHGVKLERSQLGRGSVLPPRGKGPRLAVGDARVGTTTVLT